MAKTKTRGNGEGTIYNNGKYWVGQVTVGRDPDTGKYIRKTIYSKTRREAQEKITEIQSQYNKGEYLKESDMTVSEWVKYWLENFKSNSINATSYSAYNNRIKQHIIKPFGNIKLKDLNSLQIQEYYNKMKNDGFSNNYIKENKMVLNSALSQAMKLDMIKKNVCGNIILPKHDENNKIKVLTRDDQAKFIEYCYKNNELLFIFLLGTGVRISEALGLTWDCIDFIDDTIAIKQISVRTKGGLYLQSYSKTVSSMRSIPISEKIKNILVQQKQNSSKFVFESIHGNMCSHSVISTKLANIFKGLKITPISIHGLRHTFATRMLEAGCNIKVLSTILGHKNIQITLDTYAHVLPDEKKENMLKIDEFL